ncbi:protein RarD [Actinorhabdospora filicis]|uniref:Protein RarD n=1 Tax=Actinorhabdospora filicis TaxID=1785913 RepID=A0A9W6STQ7_9ACTN|nr:EamA family transporter RarD [Actinorhabdospora filicis]GLZ81780.1 protein RarD [Actinorhabdospora filicis]
MSDSRRGYLAAFAAYGMWGLVPLYWKLVKPAGAVEILGHRILWSVAFTGLLLYAVKVRTKKPSALGGLLKNRRKLLGVGIAALVITVNWGIYIYGVNAGRVVETSLGYFINPLVSVALGVAFFGERLRPWQWAAVATGAVAVGVLTLDYGHPPWIALALAFSFAAYGAVKKRLGLPPGESLFVESAFMAIPALAFIGWLEASGRGTFASISVGHALLLAGGGVVTAVPLIFFGAAANRLPLSVMGMIQYIGPVLQFAIGVFVFGEDMPVGRWLGFGLVWGALALFSFDAVRRVRAVRREPVAVSVP